MAVLPVLGLDRLRAFRAVLRLRPDNPVARDKRPPVSLGVLPSIWSPGHSLFSLLCSHVDRQLAYVLVRVSRGAPRDRERPDEDFTAGILRRVPGSSRFSAVLRHRAVPR